jgi:hypothetical protein
MIVKVEDHLLGSPKTGNQIGDSPEDRQADRDAIPVPVRQRGHKFEIRPAPGVLGRKIEPVHIDKLKPPFPSPDRLLAHFDGSAQHGFQPGEKREGRYGPNDIILYLVEGSDQPVVVGKELFRVQVFGL